MYHFIRVIDGKPTLGCGDNRVVEVGVPVTIEGDPILCEHGLHASRRIIDALLYIPGDDVALCEVTLGGIVLHGNDKSVGTERTIVRMLTVEQTDVLLREFARWCALSVAHLWDMPAIVREYLETGDKSKREAAQAAAGAGVSAAAGAAAWSAARAAAWDSARAAAGAAAWDSARAAARAAAAMAAAAEGASATQEAKLREMFAKVGGG